MGIDGINKPGSGPVRPELGGGKAVTDFEDQLTSGEVSEPAQVGASGALQQLDAGTISVDEYLDLQVNEAVAHLQGKLPGDQLDFVKESLRAQLSEDPVLLELVRRATGDNPSVR